MKYLTIVILSMLSLACYGQQYAMRLNDGYYCGLNLVNDGTYYIDIVPPVEDAVVLLPSFGKYSETATHIYLHDEPNHLELVMRKVSNTTLSVEKGFGFMKKARFKLSDSDPCDTNFAYPWSGDSRNRMMEAYKNNDSVSHQLPLGEYRTQKYRDPSFSISLLSDSTYFLKYRRIVLSTGTFRRENNLLEMRDEDLNGSFHMLINDKQLDGCKFISTDNKLFYDEWE